MKDTSEIGQYSLKYRPRCWEDVYGQDNTVKALRKRIIEKNFPTAVLLQGKYGCGKTTIAEIFAAAMQASLPDGNPDWSKPACKAILNGTFDRDTIRLDGAQLSGKSDVIEATQDLHTRPFYDARKVVIIEECDQISSAGMKSLLKVLESVPSWVTIILLSMEDNVNNAIKSRCQKYNIKPLSISDMMYGMKHILEQTGAWEDPNIPQSFKMEGLATIASVSEGSMRNAVQYLETCLINEAYDKLSITNLLEVVDEATIREMLVSLLKGEKDERVLRNIAGMKSGDQAMHFFNYATMMLAEAVLYKETKVACDDECEKFMKELASYPEVERLFYCLTLHPQMNKPYMRTSDIVTAIASFYQGIDFRPNNTKIETNRPEQKIVIGVPPTTPVAKTPVRIRRTADPSLENTNIPF